MKLQMMTGAALFLLAACGGPAPATDGAAMPETASAPQAAPLPPPAPAVDPGIMGPVPGLWRTKVSMSGMTMPPADECVTQRVTLEQAQKMQAQAGITCANYSFRREGAGIVGNYTCTMADGGKTSAVETITGDMTTAYSTTIVTTSETPRPGVPNPMTMTVSAERVGDCPA